MTRYCSAICFFLLILVAPAGAIVAESSAVKTDEETLVAPSGQLIEERRETDKKQSLRPLTLVSHKPNYLIGSYYFSKPQTSPFEIQYPEENVHLNPVELKFQLSLKTLIFADLIGTTGDLWVGYTNRSFWQAFHAEKSSPFRETSHEPELWFDFATDLPLGSVSFKGANIGMMHQSNGQWGEVSRSWNRIYGMFMFQKGDLYFAVKPWWRIHESRSNDDNRDIEKYLGNCEFYALKNWSNQSLGIMLRNNLRFDGNNHGAVQLDYTFPLHKQLRGYLQYFSGYGESMIDYDNAVQTLGVGVMLSNWL